MPPRPDQSVDWREVLIARAALETGLLGALERARPVDEAADAAGLDRRAARIVSAALVGTGYLEEAGGGLRATGTRPRPAPAAGDGGDPAGELHLEARAMRSHLGLEETLRTGMPVDDVSAGDRVTIERFMRAMRQVAAPRAPDSVAALGAPAPGARLLDVGGAPGTYARAFAAAGWDVTVLDRPGDPRGDGGRPAGSGDRDGRGRRHRAPSPARPGTRSTSATWSTSSTPPPPGIWWRGRGRRWLRAAPWRCRRCSATSARRARPSA